MPSRAADGWSDPVERIIADWNAELPGVDGAPMRIVGRLARLNGLVAPHLKACFAQDQLDSGLFDVLAALRRAGRPYRSTPTALARLTMVTTGGITGRIDRLEQTGLVERESADGDRRVTYVRLTARGAEVVDRALAQLLETERRLLAGLTAGQARRLAGDLADLERSISNSENSLRPSRA